MWIYLFPFWGGGIDMWILKAFWEEVMIPWVILDVYAQTVFLRDFMQSET